MVISGTEDRICRLGVTEETDSRCGREQVERLRHQGGRKAQDRSGDLLCQIVMSERSRMPAVIAKIAKIEISVAGRRVGSIAIYPILRRRAGEIDGRGKQGRSSR